MVIALLAILKAGGAYVPLDPDYPEERLAVYAGRQRASGIVDPGGSVRHRSLHSLIPENRLFRC